LRHCQLAHFLAVLGFYLFQGIEMQTDFMHEAFDSDPKHRFSLSELYYCAARPTTQNVLSESDKT